MYKLKRSIKQRPSFLVLLIVLSPNDIMQKIEKTLNNTHTSTEYLINNDFRNTKKHPQNATGFTNKTTILRVHHTLCTFVCRDGTTTT